MQALVVGGQACVFYGAAEFSRDLDLALSVAPENLRKLEEVLKEIQAELIAVPLFSRQSLEAGHAVHFRCHAPGVEGLRIDILHAMRGVDPFESLWARRTTLETEDGLRVELLSLPDLVQAKKTQRDKDWLMLRRLVEANYYAHHDNPSGDQLSFWLLEARTSGILLNLASDYPSLTESLLARRPLLAAARQNDVALVESLLAEEEQVERQRDREYWKPLRLELERLRRERRGQPKS